MMSDTICAVSTASGLGAIAIVRVSGDQAIETVDSIFQSSRKNFKLNEAKTHTAHYGKILNDKTEVIDEVLATVFRAPNSFTGEDSVEIACHGSHYIQQEIIKQLLSKGCRIATHGEFTQRAFANGRMDLSQAEAVADLIACQNKASHRLAMNQMRGGFSKEISILRDRLLTFTSLVELELDFSDHEELEFADRSELKALAEEILKKIGSLKNSFSTGNAIKNGIPVSIIGETNAGKSTLLNYLLKEDKAIVSDIHGTTRDVIEDTVIIDGLLFRFIDTAGLRNTSDVIENMGIERSYKMMDKASIVLWVIDASQPLHHLDELSVSIMEHLQDKKLIKVFNKVDLIDDPTQQAFSDYYKKFEGDELFISAKHTLNTDQLEELLVKAAQIPEIGENDVMVTNMRHYEALNNAYSAILRVQDGLENNISGDFLSQDIRECLHYLGEITGEITTDEVLGTIFSRFCIGK
ncbi:MAG: tRNA uridine-5-carboxymethylaminomethyl(34) synthesis GTPase MnmE [Paludibacteraceae bacterium]|nr:tRNA uridine-5-carboxymethylaminomethyl(34) synthesis GTPase MnmE [Paludibacteraceae bacterium]